ncbi:MAG TPA: vWA domain-containing protein [Gaiellales bacterium]|nr:vWA domain-containing protein [Gaiellales bacterium]
MSRLLRAAILAVTLGIGGIAAPFASADLFGRVSGSAPQGGPFFPLAAVSVTATDATGTVLATALSDVTGQYRLVGVGQAGVATPALTVTYAYTDPCEDAAHQKLAALQRVAAGATGTLPLVYLDALRMCAAPSSDFRVPVPVPTAYVDSADGRVIGPPGAVAYVRVPIGVPSGVPQLYGLSLWTKGFADTGFKNGALALGGNYDPSVNSPTEFRIKLPLAAGSGPITLSYGGSGPGTLLIGTVTVLNSADPATYHTPGTDIEIALDVSATMKRTDPHGLRSDAVRSLLVLTGPADRIGALTFNDHAQPIFGLQAVAATSASTLANLVDKRLADSGGTDDDAGLEGAYDALSSPKTYDPARAKTVILLTDGTRHAGDDRSAHLLLRANPSGHAWPVCVVALGSRIAATNETRLQRIATETRGQYVPARTPATLGAAFRRCLAIATGRQTLADRAVRLAKRVTIRRITAKIAPNTTIATWFAEFAAGSGERPVLIDPSGASHTSAAPGKNVSFRTGRTFALFTALHPRPGTWTLLLSPDPRANSRSVRRVTVTAA